MSRHTGLKVLTGAVVLVVLVVLSSGKTTPLKQEPTREIINNVNQAIASQFNDNIRDVSARLMEDEKKIDELAQKNQELMAQNELLLAVKEQKSEAVRDELTPEVKDMIAALKKELAEVKTQRKTTKITDYALNDSDSLASPSNHFKDMDALLVKRRLSEAELSYWQKLKTKRQAFAKKAHLKTTLPSKHG
ncbi:hypothetical protein ACQUW5_14100 [Legionella sp. CNM-1927-20]|uniref:hypothetical protein n=1 Tax=Legionella sp. CNM-1927-20 TaxID=3422221 RepID=UPI00403A8BB7